MPELPPQSSNPSDTSERFESGLDGVIPEAVADPEEGGEVDFDPDESGRNSAVSAGWDGEGTTVDAGAAATAVRMDRRRLDLLRREAALADAQRQSDRDRQALRLGRDEVAAERSRLEQVEANLNLQLGILREREHAIRQADAELNRRQDLLIGRERDADLGFAGRHRDALAVLESTWAQEERRLRLAHEERRASLMKELEEEASARRQRLGQQFKEEAERLDAQLAGKSGALAELAQALDELRGDIDKERLAAVSHLSQELARRRDEARAALDEELHRRRSEVERDLDGRDVALRQREADVASREANLIAKARETDIERELVRQERQAISSNVERLVDERHALVLDERKVTIKQLETAREECQRLREQLEGYKDLSVQLGGLDPEAITRQRREQAEEVVRLREELGRRPSEAEWSRLKSRESEMEGLQAEIDRLRHQNHTLLMQQGKWVLAVDELERHKELETAARRRRDALEAEARTYEERVKKLLSLYQQPQELKNRVEVIEQPVWIGQELAVDRSAKDMAELDWLASIEDDCAETGIVFPRRLLKAFHTSLKTAEWSPLTVLAGVSGTGKSELPRLYARYGGLLFESMAVQPNWDSPQSMLGFFNTIDNRFNATRLLRALVQSQRAQSEGGAADAMLLVLLDEMNLAHIEMYFADFLSKLEFRRGLIEEVNLEVDIGAGLDRYKVPLGRNVLWVGTMNEDETTKSLSDKVVDRGNVLGFPRPRELRRRHRLELLPAASLLPKDAWQNWQAPADSLLDEEVDGFRDTLHQLNEHLNEVGRALGHRVWQSVDNYMANHPDVLANPRDQNNDGRKRALQLAFEDALVHKVMPKLRGIETSGHAKVRCLDPIRSCLQEKAPGLYDDFELATRLGMGVFVWASARYLDEQVD
jgi:hypothetical protein